uniref:Uncharacterized protein n=1 Tax=Schistosoma curassoni TaxID=6186 RepID=A0A183JUJ9_9TREM
MSVSHHSVWLKSDGLNGDKRLTASDAAAHASVIRCIRSIILISTSTQK